MPVAVPAARKTAVNTTSLALRLLVICNLHV
jgi:hypothetical protein